jgi:hypothetical protein
MIWKKKPSAVPIRVDPREKVVVDKRAYRPRSSHPPISTVADGFLVYDTSDPRNLAVIEQRVAISCVEHVGRVIRACQADTGSMPAIVVAPWWPHGVAFEQYGPKGSPSRCARAWPSC